MFRQLLKIQVIRISGALAVFLLAVNFCRAATVTGKAEAETDAAATMTPAIADAAGKPGFFRVEKQNGVWWFITPDGNRFFSNGVNVVSKGQSPEDYNPANPEYAAFRHYPTAEAWAGATLKRLKAWNFNTIGGWSSDEITNAGAGNSGGGGTGGMPYVRVLHLGGSKYVPWGDMFGEKIVSEIDQIARRDIPGLKNDKNLIGYFTDNELGWWDDSIFIFFLREPAENKTRRVLINLLRWHYANSFARLKRDFETGKTQSFAALEREGDLSLKPNGNGAKIVDEFIFLLAGRYYKLVHDAVRRYDPNHLIMGDRFPSWYSQPVVRASIPYVDVISTNYMADWTDGNISHFYLDTLYRLTGKPVIVTEYYMSAMENRSGNKNSSAGFPVVETQKERAMSFRNNLVSFAELPYVVGAHWFQYMDEPANGREEDGENYNMGLVDINDRPYEELTATTEAIKPDLIHSETMVRKTTAAPVDFIPKAPGGMEKGLRDWDKKNALIRADAKTGAALPFADFYVCWDEENLYLAFYANDFVEPKIYRNSLIPESERMLATLKIETAENWTTQKGKRQKREEELFQIRFGYGGEGPVITGAKLEYKSVESPTRSTIIVRIPAKSFDRRELKPGDVLRVRAALASHSRAETMSWDRVLTLQKTE